jgi:hypothetical protein
MERSSSSRYDEGTQEERLGAKVLGRIIQQACGIITDYCVCLLDLLSRLERAGSMSVLVGAT